MGHQDRARATSRYRGSRQADVAIVDPVARRKLKNGWGIQNRQGRKCVFRADIRAVASARSAARRPLAAPPTDREILARLDRRLQNRRSLARNGQALVDHIEGANSRTDRWPGCGGDYVNARTTWRPP